jgi:hypothetical protein
MKKIIRKFPVTVNLLFVGIGLMAFSKFLMTESWKPLSIIGGVFSGIVVTIFEVFLNKNRFNTYKPTLIPYIILYISILFSGITMEILGFIAISPGVYLITLAIIFKIYELKTKNHWITWNELLDDGIHANSYNT